MFHSKSLAVAAVALALGCAPKQGPLATLTKIQATVPKDTFTSVLTANNPEALRSGQVHLGTLDQSSRVLEHDHYASYYKVFKFDNSSNKPVSILLQAKCDCWGFDKRMMIPMLIILDDAGKLIPGEDVAYKIEPDGQMNIQLALRTAVKPQPSSFLYFVIMANNVEPNTSLWSRKYLWSDTQQEAFTKRVLSYPMGEFALTVN